MAKKKRSDEIIYASDPNMLRDLADEPVVVADPEPPAAGGPGEYTGD